jgi:hypothetical protein
MTRPLPQQPSSGRVTPLVTPLLDTDKIEIQRELVWLSNKLKNVWCFWYLLVGNHWRSSLSEFSLSFVAMLFGITDTSFTGTIDIMAAAAKERGATAGVTGQPDLLRYTHSVVQSIDLPLMEYV